MTDRDDEEFGGVALDAARNALKEEVRHLDPSAAAALLTHVAIETLTGGGVSKREACSTVVAIARDEGRQT